LVFAGRDTVHKGVPKIAIAASASFTLTHGHAIFAKQNPIDA